MKNSYDYSENKILQTIGEHLQRERMKAKMTRYALSVKSGLHQQTIKNIEEGKINSSILTIETLTKIMNTHIII